MQTTTVEELRAGGTVLPIARWGTPVMHARTRSIREFDDTLLVLVRNMVATMYAARGVGLAATQIGVNRTVSVFDRRDDDRCAPRGCATRGDRARGQERQLDDGGRGLSVAPRRVRGVGAGGHAICRGQDHTGAAGHLRAAPAAARRLEHETDHRRDRVRGTAVGGADAAAP